MKKFVVGIDRSAGSKNALRWASSLSQRGSVEVVAGHVVNIPSAERPPGYVSEVVADRQKEIDAWLAETEAASQECEMLSGDAHSELIRLAEVQRADLLVVGTRGEGGFGDLHLGSLANRLVHDCSLPLAIVPAETQAGDGPLVVGVDGSFANSAALRWAIAVATDIKARVVPVFVHDAMADSYAHPENDHWRYRGEDQVRAELAGLEGADVVDDLVNKGGNAIEVLNNTATELGAAAVVVGTRGHWSFGRVRGRVPIQLAQHGSKPTIIVPHQH